MYIIMLMHNDMHVEVDFKLKQRKTVSMAGW